MNLFVILSFLILIHTNLDAKEVRGIVVDHVTEKPIDNCMVMLLERKTVYAFTITDSTGLFLFDNVELDRFYLRTKRMGYAEVMTGPLLMAKSDTLKIVIRLEFEGVVLDEIVVLGKRIEEMLMKNGFYERKEMGFGHYVTYKEIKNRSFDKVTNILQPIPGIIITYNIYDREKRQFVTKITSKRNAGMPVNIYVDGFSIGEPMYLDSLNPYDIAAVEYYPSSATAPSEFGGGWRPGGLLLIWTKR